MANNICKVCGNKITMMAQKGTDFCSKNCEDGKVGGTDPTINYSAGVTPHRGTGTSPTPAHRPTTFRGSANG